MRKKGLLLSLLVVAVVCMSVPAGARAPIVNPLPDIIIGSAGDQNAAGTAHLLRYLDIVEIGTPGWITTQNGMGTANLSVYYASYSDNDHQDASTIIKDSDTTGIIEPLNTAERAFLQGPGHVSPNPAKMINYGDAGEGFSWLTLYNSAVSSSTLINAYDLDPEVDGVAPAQFPSNWDDVSTLTIYALEVDGAVRLLGKASSFVWSELDVEDRVGDLTVLLDLNATDLLNGWVPQSVIGEPGAYDPGIATGLPGTGLGFVDPPGDNTVAVYGEWQSGLATNPGVVAAIIAADEVTVGANNILHLTATLGSNAATAAESTGYRMMYAADAFQHLGGVLVETTPARGPAPAPATGADFDLELYWAVPYSLTEYADGEVLSDFGSVTGGSFDDARDYKLIFGMLDSDATDVDAIWLSNLKVEVIGRPAGKVPSIAWGGGQVPFNDPTQGFQESEKQAVVGGVVWPRGGVVYSATGSWLDIGPGLGDTGYQEAAPRPAAFGVGILWSANKLVRYRMVIASATDVEKSPMFRILGLIWKGAIPQNIIWVDEYGPNNLAKLFMETPGGVTSGAPAVPKALGSVIETYYYTHIGGDPPANLGLLAPTLDVYNPGWYAPGSGSGWQEPNGLLRISTFSTEDGI